MPVSARIGKLSLVAMLALGSLTGCTTVSPSTIAAVERLDPASLNAAGIRLALVTPTTFRPDAGQPEFTLSVGTVHGEIATRTFTFTEEVSAGERAPLQAEIRTGSELRVFALSAEDAAALQRQIDVVTATVAPGEGDISLTMGVAGCVTDRAGRLPATIYVRLAPAEPYRVLLRSSDLSSTSALGSTIRFCSGG